jgi:hypothetical protein
LDGFASAIGITWLALTQPVQAASYKPSLLIESLPAGAERQAITGVVHWGLVSLGVTNE